MAKTVSEKMGLKEGARGIFINASTETVDAIRHPPSLHVAQRLNGSFDYIHFFAVQKTQLEKKIPVLKNHLKPNGTLWVSWPKARQQNTDLNLPEVIKIGYNYGLVESKTLSVDSTWSAIKFTHPKKGKVYKNSYGSLKK